MVKSLHHKEPEVIEDLHTKFYRPFFKQPNHEILPVCNLNIYLPEGSFAPFAVVKKNVEQSESFAVLAVFA